MTMTRIFHRLYLGDADDAERLARSNPSGIAVVISLSESPVERRNPRIRYLAFPLPEATPIGIETLNLILAAMTNSIRNGAVLVHCRLGMSRSPAMVAAYLDRIGYLDFEDALQFLHHLRSRVDPSPILLRSVQHTLQVQTATGLRSVETGGMGCDDRWQ